MLSAELRGHPYSKAEHRRRLQPVLQGRSQPAIEWKRCNISATLIELGCPYIEGYKPAWNYQQLLFDVVSARLAASPELEELIAADADAEVPPPTVDDILHAMVSPPIPTRADRVRETAQSTLARSSRVRRVDYLLRESQNSSLGRAGEVFVLNYERARLLAAGRDQLATDVEHVSKTRGDGLGFDILSFEGSGRERLIEVKTTKYGAETPFYVSANEVRVSEVESDHYYLYRVFSFRQSPKLFHVAGSVSACFSLNPTQYVAKVI